MKKTKTNVEIMWTQMARSALVTQWTVQSHLCSILYMLTYYDLFQREQVKYSAKVVTRGSHIPLKQKKTNKQKQSKNKKQNKQLSY